MVVDEIGNAVSPDAARMVLGGAMKIIRGRDGADLLPPGRYQPRYDAGLPAYELWEMQQHMNVIWEGLAAACKPAIDAMTRFVKEIKVLPDPKAEARQRSRDDLTRKRKDLMKRRGKR